MSSNPKNQNMKRIVSQESTPITQGNISPRINVGITNQPTNTVIKPSQKSILPKRDDNSNNNNNRNESEGVKKLYFQYRFRSGPQGWGDWRSFRAEPLEQVV